MSLTNIFTGSADPVSSWTHLLGACVFAVLALPLFRRAARVDDEQTELASRSVRIASVAVFVFSAILLLAVSGLYHRIGRENPARIDMLRLDYAAIFVLIAGSFTPPMAILHSGRRRQLLLLVIWSIAITGIVLRLSFFSTMPHSLGVGIYLVFGWMGAIGAIVVARRFSVAFVQPLVISGTVYTVGAAVQIAGRPNLVPGVFGSHELFHVAVLVGLAFHWRFVWQFADGTVPQRECSSDDETSEPDRQPAWDGVGGTMP